MAIIVVLVLMLALSTSQQAALIGALVTLITLGVKALADYLKQRGKPTLRDVNNTLRRIEDKMRSRFDPPNNQ